MFSLAPGFLAASLRVPIDPNTPPDKDDLAAVYCESSARVVGMLPKEGRLAPCVRRNAPILAEGAVRLIVVHSENANCGYPEAEHANNYLAVAAAAAFSCSPQEVLTAGTGIIGVPLPIEHIVPMLPCLRDRLSAGGGERLARAIMTSDTYPKKAMRVIPSGATISAVSKGTIMIAPRLATTITIITTDADLPTPTLRAALESTTNATFRRLNKDDVPSPSDMIILLSSGQGPKPDFTDFGTGLTGVVNHLAESVWRDGVDMPILVAVTGAPTQQQAEDLAQLVARCNFFKSTIRARLVRIGRLWPILPPDASVFINDIELIRKGSVLMPSTALSPGPVTVSVSIGAGGHAHSVMTA